MSSGQAVMTALEQAKAATGIHTLPCGYLDATGTLHKEVVVREITGAEEDILANQKIPFAKRMSELYARCVTRVGTITDYGMMSSIVKDMLIGDRLYLTFAIRRATFGDGFPYISTCPKCDREGMFEVDLADLTVKAMPDPMKRIFDVKLPSGRDVRFKIMNGNDEERLAKLQKSNPGDTISLMLLAKTELLDGKPPTMADMKSMHMADRRALQEMFTDVEGGVDTEMEMGCEFCGHEFRQDLEVGQEGFFFPSAARKSWKKRSSG